MTELNDDQPTDGAISPIFEYQHGDAGCSVSGGAVYRGSAVPALDGWYVYGDYCSGQITGLRVADQAVAQVLTLGNVPAVAAVAAGPSGELYVMSTTGGVFQLTAA